LKAGKYGFFVIPNQEEWTVIFNMLLRNSWIIGSLYIHKIKIKVG
jgi:hypothetical protein